MRSQEYWQIFLETGAPEMYLLYNNARKRENAHVFNNEGLGYPSNQLQ